MQYIPLRSSSMFVASCQYDFWRLKQSWSWSHIWPKIRKNFENVGYPTDRYFSRRNNCGAYFALEPPQYLPSIEIGRDKHHSLGGRIFGSNADGHSWKSRMQVNGGGHFCFMPAFFSSNVPTSSDLENILCLSPCKHCRLSSSQKSSFVCETTWFLFGPMVWKHPQLPPGRLRGKRMLTLWLSGFPAGVSQPCTVDLKSHAYVRRAGPPFARQEVLRMLANMLCMFLAMGGGGGI